MSIRITHVRLTPGGTRHEHITDLQWVRNQDGPEQSSTKRELITWIAAKEGGAFVGSPLGKVPVGVVNPVGMLPYLRSYADEEWTDSLLSLPRF